MVVINLDNLKYGFWLSGYGDRSNAAWRKFVSAHTDDIDMFIIPTNPYDYEEILNNEYNATVIEFTDSYESTEYRWDNSTQWFIKFDNETDYMLFMLRWG